MGREDASRKDNVVSNLIVSAEKYRAKWKALGEPMIESLNRGQNPRILAVGPAFVGGLKILYGKEAGQRGGPGKVFEVTCRRDGTLDEEGLGSVYYGLAHLKINRLDIWGSDFTTHERTIAQIRDAGIQGFGKVLVRKSAVNGDIRTNLGNAKAGVLSCSDSRVLPHEIFGGTEIAVVSNAGNVLSPVAVEVFSELVRAGVPVLAVLGHSKCGAVAAAVNGSGEAPIQPIVERIRANLSSGNETAWPPEAINAYFTSTRAEGEGAAVTPFFFDLETGDARMLVMMGR